MGFFSSLFSSPVAPQSQPQNAAMPMWGDWGNTSGSSYAGVNVTTTSALQLLTVYGCAGFITDGICTLPIGHFDKQTDGSSKPMNATPDWVTMPTADLEFMPWVSQLLMSLLLSGNSWALRGFSGTKLTSLTPIDPTLVKPDRSQGRLRWNINGDYRSTFEILHIPGIMFPGSDVGMDPVSAAKQVIGTGMGAEEYAARFFGDDPTPPGVIELEGNLNPEMARQMARSWSRAHSGKEKRSLPGVLEGGAKWKPTIVNNEQAQFLQTRNLSRAQIAAELFRIDPSEMGIPVEGKSLTYSNMEERAIRRVQVTFLPWIRRIEKALSAELPGRQYLKFNVSGVLRGDTKTRYEAYSIAIDKGFLTVEEARAFEDWAPLPDQGETAMTITEKIEALGGMIRAGFDPAASAEFLGLPPIKHTGLVPVTVKDPDPPAPQEAP